MKKIVSVLMLVFALMFGAVLSGCGGGLEGITNLDTTNDDYKFNNLQAQIDALQIRIDALIVAGVPGPQGEPGDDGLPGISPEEIQALTEDLEALNLQLEALKLQVGTDSNVGESLEQAIERLDDRVTAIQTLIDELIENGCPPRGDGGPAYVFSGSGEPSDDLNARTGDFYISMTDTPGFGYMVYLYTDAGWVEFGYIKKDTGPSSPVRVERF